MKITGLPTKYDNYIWILQSETTSDAWVVDPGESDGVISFFQEHDLKLKGILLTHHHYDHKDGIAEVLNKLGKVPIISNTFGPYKKVTQHVNEGDKIQVLDEEFEIIYIPGHSHEHIAFYNAKSLFCGDVLFTAGCGKAWCQSSNKMAESLLKLRKLNDNCLVYCGHEYTYGNINFAAIAEPKNEAIKKRQQEVAEKTRLGIPCAPEKLGIEKDTNPFLRFDTAELKQKLIAKEKCFENFSLEENGNLYANLRAWKDILDKTGELEQGANTL